MESKTMSGVMSNVRTELKRLLALTTEPQQRMFKLMYGRKNGKRSVEDSEKMNIDDAVDEVPDDKLNWACCQVERTLEITKPITP